MLRSATSGGADDAKPLETQRPGQDGANNKPGKSEAASTTTAQPAVAKERTPDNLELKARTVIPHAKEREKKTVTAKPKPGQRRPPAINLAGDIEATRIPKKGASRGKQKKKTGETANPEGKMVPRS